MLGLPWYEPMSSKHVGHIDCSSHGPRPKMFKVWGLGLQMFQLNATRQRPASMISLDGANGEPTSLIYDYNKKFSVMCCVSLFRSIMLILVDTLQREPHLRLYSFTS